MIKITLSNNSPLWLNINAISHIAPASQPTKCTIHLTDGSAWNVLENTDSLAGRVNTKLYAIHHTPDYRE